MLVGHYLVVCAGFVFPDFFFLICFCGSVRIGSIHMLYQLTTIIT